MMSAKFVISLVVLGGFGLLSCCPMIDEPAQRVESFDDEVFFEFVAVRSHSSWMIPK